MEQPEEFACPDCGHSWRHGENGNHSCVDTLRRQNVALTKDLHMARKILDGLATAEQYRVNALSAAAVFLETVEELPNPGDYGL